MKKIIFIFILINGIISGIFIAKNTLPATYSDLLLENLDALAKDNEDNSGSYTCYSTFNNCWFWNCSTIYRCGNPCEDASADAYSDKGSCSKS